MPNVNQSSNNNEITQDSHESIFCPISNEIMQNPYVLNCGHSFEMKNIDEWIKKKNNCPICN